MVEFSPNNNIVKLCIQGMAAEEKGASKEAVGLFRTAWAEAADGFEKYLAAFYLARHQKTAAERLEWLETAIRYAEQVGDDPSVVSAFPALFSDIADCHAGLGDLAKAEKFRDLGKSFANVVTDKGPFFHGTKADLDVGDLLAAGGSSNYEAGLVMNHIYFTALPNGAGLAAALAKGEGHERVYVVEPTDSFESDPNVTNKKFPGNPTRSYRSEFPLRVIGEVLDWAKQTPEQIRSWREKLASSKGAIIN